MTTLNAANGAPTTCALGISVVFFDNPQAFAETFTVRVATTSVGAPPSAFSNTAASCTVNAGAYSCVSAGTATVAAGSVIDVALTFSGTFSATQRAAVAITCQ